MVENTIELLGMEEWLGEDRINNPSPNCLHFLWPSPKSWLVRIETNANREVIIVCEVRQKLMGKHATSFPTVKMITSNEEYTVHR